MKTHLFGAVVDVSTVNTGSNFAADEAIGQTVLSLDDVAIFGELGGTVYIDGTTYEYTSVDTVLNTMTILTGLVVAATSDTRAEVYPPAPIRTALVDFGDDGGEVVKVTIPATLTLPDGLRPELDREIVQIDERDPGELYLADVVAQGMTLLRDGEDLDNQTSVGNFIQMSSDGAASGTNYPLPYAGVLEVISTQPQNVMLQRYTSWRTAADLNYPSAWVRTFGDGAWSTWKPLNPTDPVVADTAASSALTLTATATLIPGLTKTFTPPSANAVYLVIGVMDTSGTNAATGTAVGELFVDSTAETEQIIFATPGATSGGGRGSVSQTWIISGLSVASHTLQLRGRVSGGSGFTAQFPHSTLKIIQLSY